MVKLNQTIILVVIMALNLCTQCAYAQYDDERVFYGGLVLGGNFTQVDGDNFAGYNKAGINGGAIMYAKMAEKFAMSMEILYSQKGSRASNNQVPTRGLDQSTIVTYYKIITNYAEIPIMLNYFEEKKSNFGAGFSYNQLLSSKEIYKNETGAVFDKGAVTYPFKKYDINFLLNGNAHLMKGLYLNLRFQYSILSIRKTPNPVTTAQSRPVTNNIWTVRMMYMF